MRFPHLFHVFNKTMVNDRIIAILVLICLLFFVKGKESSAFVPSLSASNLKKKKLPLQTPPPCQRLGIQGQLVNRLLDPSPSSSQDEKKFGKSQQYADGIFRTTKRIDETCVPWASYSGSMNIPLKEVDVLYERSTDLFYDPVEDRYRKRVKQEEEEEALSSSSRRGSLGQFFRRVIAPQLSVAFLPSGVTPNYYKFMRWRILQRFFNANLHVFGTQSLLMGLGLKSSASQLGALSAALKWVLKDALGKIVRMAWASRMGRRFDSDAKRWRFRSAFVYAVGNALEMTTYILPNMFLVWATLANCCKQISMLTSSSTRTAIYNSFRDGTRENIGDITAKGEAQIAIIDLLGIASGVALSKSVGTKLQPVLGMYAVLQVMELVCMYRQLRTVEYRVLNFERMVEVINDFLDTTEMGGINGAANRLHTNSVVNTTRVNPAPDPVNGDPLPSHESEKAGDNVVGTVSILTRGIKTPPEMARAERIFSPPKHLSRRATAFGSFSRTKLSPGELSQLMKIFANERFLLVVGANLKNPYLRIQQERKPKDLLIQEHCHIVLHKEATNADIVKSSLALLILRRKLVDYSSKLEPWTMRSSDCFDIIQQSLEDTERLFSMFRKQLSKQGWESPARFMFGRVHMRAEWPLSTLSTKVSNGV